MNTISSKEDVIRVLKENNVKVFGVGGTPITRTEVHPVVDDFELICSVSSKDLDSVQEKIKASCFPMRNEAGFFIKKPGKIISNPEVTKHIEEGSQGKKVAILVMKPTEEVLGACEKNGWALLGNNPDVVWKYDDKNEFQQLLKRANIPSSAISLSLTDLEESLDEIFKKLGDNIVIQLPKSAGGKGTFFFNKKEKEKIISSIKQRIEILSEEVPEDAVVIVNSFFEGPSLSTLGCITRDNGTLECDPQYQLIDIEDVVKGKSDGTGVFCGHDWVLSSDIPQNIRKQAREITEKIGEELKKDGALGVFGVDFVWDRKRDILVANEINVRITGTFPTIVHSQLEAGEVPLIAFHILDFLKIPYSIENRKVYNKGGMRKGAHLILFNPFGYDVICNKEVPGGVYSLDKKGDAKFERLGFEMEDIKNPGEFIVTDGVPAKGFARGKNRKVLKIITKEPICDNPEKLNNWGSMIVDATYKMFDFKKS